MPISMVGSFFQGKLVGLAVDSRWPQPGVCLMNTGMHPSDREVLKKRRDWPAASGEGTDIGAELVGVLVALQLVLKATERGSDYSSSDPP